MKREQELLLLLFGSSPTFEKEITDALTGSSFLVTTHSVRDTTAFYKAITVQKWQMAICECDDTGSEVEIILRQIRDFGADLPVLVVGSPPQESRLIKLMEAGAVDFFLYRRLAGLPYALRREFDARETRLTLRKIRSQLDEKSAELEIKSLGAQQAESDLKKEATRRQVLMNASRDGIAIFNQEHEVVEANHRFSEMLGYTHEEALQLHTWDLEDNMCEADIREAFGNLAQTSATFETKHRRKDGSTYDAEVSASGALVGDEPMVFTVSRDITEKKKIQASLAQSDRLTSMGMLAAGVAHEINNPLAYVLYNLETLAREMPFFEQKLRSFRRKCHSMVHHGSLEALRGDFYASFGAIDFDKYNKRIREALEGTRRIQDIAGSLSTFSRVERRQLVSVDVHYTIECAANMAFNEIKYRAKFVKDFGCISNVMASEGHISQVFLNLLINAVHAVEEGHVEDNEIRVRTWQDGEMVCIEVRDTGKGISKDNMRRIFEPFFTTKNVGEGSGLGLSISRNIITGYGGDIDVQSEEGKGTSFIIRLPVRTDSAEIEDEINNDCDAVTVSGGNILIIDDEINIVNALADILYEYKVTTAYSARDAITKVDERPHFDAILCDLMMPEVTGMAFHEWISEKHPALANKIIFVTGGAFTPNAREFLTRVPNTCLNKPFNLSELKQAVAQMVTTSPK
ncbi:MAG: response regulator [Deltaproteobacteria bacterium]|nr:response regulator [Deltaproteobacteria bacterium]